MTSIKKEPTAGTADSTAHEGRKDNMNITETEATRKPKRMSQTDMLAEHLIEHGSITSLEAIELYGCTRLSARIWDLRHKLELPVVSTPECGKSRFGRTVNYTRYSLGGRA